ncbi:MAG: hypothetical protein IKA36_02185 [Clostridia bacterium]|nr:hypothetical protein [Clostridia bacterium]
MSRKNKNKQQVVKTEELENTPLTDGDVSSEETTEDTLEESTSEVVETAEEVQEESVEEVPAEDVEDKQEEVKKEEAPVVEEKKEVKPIPTKGVLIVEKKTVTAPAEKVVPESVQRFNALAQKYIDVMGKDMIEEEDRKKGVLVLTSLANYVLMSTDNRVFEACFTFFMKNRAIMLVPDRVTDGLYKYGDRTKVTKIVQWYVTFQSLVESKLLKSRFSLNVTTLRRTFNNDSLANWLVIKKK